MSSLNRKKIHHYSAHTMHSFKFGALAVLLAALPFSCSRVNGPQTPEFRFMVADVGQGLSQIGIRGSTAIVWDIGPAASMDRWMSAYQSAGSPRIAALSISHTDEDHRGGLSVLPESVDFSGMVITPRGADTGLVRAESGAWKDRVRFRCIAAGDTMGGLDGVLVRCVWPDSADTAQENAKNRFSLCFSVTFGATSLLITSDIDTVAEQELEVRLRYDLRADILVVPHHGSASSAGPAFFGYVRPAVAIISCESPPNEYGFPSDEALALLALVGADVRKTYASGDIALRSNGSYWQ